MTPRRGEYGVDAPYAPLFMLLGSLGPLVGATFRVLHGELGSALLMIACAAFLWGSAGSYLFTTRAGKFRVWDEILQDFSLRGDEQLLDMGCGRGAVLLLAAQRLTSGRATGIDLWQVKDQSGNSAEATKKNAELEGVADRVDLHTGDMRHLPFPDHTFDVVVSSLAIHNIPDAEGRAAAVREAARVLKPGGRLAIADIRN